MLDIKVIIQDDNKTNAPLFAQYHNQCASQPAYIEPTEIDGEIVLECWYSGEVGGGTSMDVYNGKQRHWTVPSNVSREALEALADSAEIYELVNTFWNGFDIEHDGSNWVGVLTEQAQDAEEQIEYILSTLETVDVWDAKEWAQEGFQLAEFDAKGVKQYAKEMLDAVECNQAVVGDMEEALEELAEEAREEGN